MKTIKDLKTGDVFSYWYLWGGARELIFAIVTDANVRSFTFDDIMNVDNEHEVDIDVHFTYTQFELDCEFRQYEFSIPKPDPKNMLKKKYPELFL